MEKKYSTVIMNEEIVKKFKEAQTCLVRLEKQLKDKKLQIKYKESEIRQLRFIIQNLDIDSILTTYKQQFPFHKPFVYWKALRGMFDGVNESELKRVLKQHWINMYVRWQLQPPKLLPKNKIK